MKYLTLLTPSPKNSILEFRKILNLKFQDIFLYLMFQSVFLQKQNLNLTSNLFVFYIMILIFVGININLLNFYK